MPRPTRYEKTVIVGLPLLLGASLLVRLFTRDGVSAVALWVYVALAVTMMAWGRRHDPGRRPSRRQRHERTVLAVLSERHGGMYGLHLSQETRLGPGRLLPALERLERRGLVDSWWVDSWDAAGPRRRYYGLTDAGRDEHARATR